MSDTFLTVRGFSTLPPLSLYIHLPWCIRKCPYCDFNSHHAGDSIPELQYVGALLRDLEQELPAIWGRRLTSIFIGGGTPSLFSPESLDRLLSGIRARISCLPDMEITLEANPGTFEQQKFNEYRALGINRLSLGIQSFNDDALQQLGRVHSGLEAHRAAEHAKKTGFDNLNLDLMFGLPGQNHHQALSDIQTAIALQPSHISYYQLTIEEGTRFHQYPPTLPESDAVWGRLTQSQELLAIAGYRQYEVSAYGQEGRQCRHNLNYWQFGDYIGIGAGAHGKISRADDGSICRRWKIRHPQHYMEHSGATGVIAGEQTIQDNDIPLEFMMNALRLKEGFEAPLFEAHTGCSMDVLQPKLQQALEAGLLTWNQSRDRIQPTEQGYRFLNNLLEIFL